MFETIKNKALLILLIICLSGCFDKSIEININPDGSGKAILKMDFNRANEKEKSEIKKRLKNPNFSHGWSEQKTKEAFPEPYFKILKYLDDKEKLLTEIEISFQDINRLFSEPTRSFLEFNHVNFDINDQKQLLFIIKPHDNWTIPTKRIKGTHPHLNISFNSPISQKITYSRNLTDQDMEKEWSQQLTIPNHSIIKKNIKHTFADWPIININDIEVESAEWFIHKDRFNRPNVLDINIIASVPTDNYKYIDWSHPTLLEGQYKPTNQELKLLLNNSLSHRGDFSNQYNTYPEGKFGLDIKYEMPTTPQSSISKQKLRIKARRSNKYISKNLGIVKVGNVVEHGIHKFTIDKIDKNYISFKVKGNIHIIKQIYAKTKNQNLFYMETGSTSTTGNSGHISFKITYPLEKSELYIDFYDHTENCWLDIHIPSFTLSNKHNSIKTKSWRERIKKQWPNRFKNKIKSLTPSISKSKTLPKEFLRSLKNYEIFNALLQYSVSADLKHNSSFLSEFLNELINNRPKYFEKNKAQLIKMFWNLGTLLPKDSYNKYIFSNHNLLKDIRPYVLNLIDKGHTQYISNAYLDAKDENIDFSHIKKAFFHAKDWVEAKDILELINTPDELPFYHQVFNDSKQHSFVRQKALNLISSHSSKFPTDYFYKALQISELRQSSLQNLKNELRRNPNLKLPNNIISYVNDIAEVNHQYIANEAKAIQKYFPSELGSAQASQFHILDIKKPIIISIPLTANKLEFRHLSITLKLYVGMFKNEIKEGIDLKKQLKEEGFLDTFKAFEPFVADKTTRTVLNYSYKDLQKKEIKIKITEQLKQDLNKTLKSYNLRPRIQKVEFTSFVFSQ